MKSRHVLALLAVVGALAAIGVVLQTISLRFVDWGEPLPWEDGKPYVARIAGASIAEGTMVLLGPTVVGRVSDEHGKNGEPVMRIDRKLTLGRETRFELHSVGPTRSIVVIPGGTGKLEAWEVVGVETPPSRTLDQ